MARDSALFATGLAGTIAASVWFSTIIDEPPDDAGPISTAIIDIFSEFIPVDQIGNPNADDVGTLALCLTAAPSMDLSGVADELSGTMLRYVPNGGCSSKRVEGDFGMFVAMTYYYDENGKDASNLKIVDVSCATQRFCTVDIDTHAFGMRYSVRRVGGDWTISERDLRWIV